MIGVCLSPDETETLFDSCLCFVQTFLPVFDQISVDDIYLDVCKNKLQKGEKSTSRKGMYYSGMFKMAA